MQQQTTANRMVATIRALLAAGWRNDSIHQTGSNDTVRTMLHPSGREITASTNRYDGDTTLTLTGLDLDQVAGAITGAGLAEPADERPTTPRAALVAALHRLADQIQHNNLPIPTHTLHVGGCVETRADAERWAEHLGVSITMGGTAGNIPVACAKVPAGDDGPKVEVSFQAPSEPTNSEVDRLRAENEALRAQLAGGAR